MEKTTKAELEMNIHEWFGLTYAQYLTIPRTALQSMPEDWQKKIVKLLDELDSTIDWRPKGGTCYQVRLMTLKYSIRLDKDVWGRAIPDDLADYKRGRRKLPFINVL